MTDSQARMQRVATIVAGLVQLGDPKIEMMLTGLFSETEEVIVGVAEAINAEIEKREYAVLLRGKVVSEFRRGIVGSSGVLR